MRIFYGVKVINKENVPSSGKAILCGNHISTMDGPLIVAFTDRNVNFLAKKEAWNSKLSACFLNKFKAISVDRGKLSLETFRKIKKVLENEELLGIFPEGTRNGLAKGLDVKEGAALIGAKYSTPIVPIKISGNYRLFHRVWLIYGKPFYVSNREDGTREIMQRISDMDSSSKVKAYKMAKKNC
jgi:1-acyl-sn-glycerol-3-phosphate acyltransferase